MTGATQKSSRNFEWFTKGGPSTHVQTAILKAQRESLETSQNDPILTRGIMFRSESFPS